MRKRISLAILTIVIVAGFSLSFEKTPAKTTIKQLIDESVESKMKRYQDIRAKRCTETILEEAGKIADSTIIARAKALRIIQDTLDRPTAIERPNRPELLVPIDSSFPVPILENGDSILNLDQN